MLEQQTCSAHASKNYRGRNAVRKNLVRAAALPPQSILGGGIGRGAKPPSE
jgi:hypothetical protein